MAGDAPLAAEAPKKNGAKGEKAKGAAESGAKRSLVLPAQLSLADSAFATAVVLACALLNAPLAPEEVSVGSVASFASDASAMAYTEVHAAVHAALGDKRCTCRAEDVNVFAAVAASRHCAAGSFPLLADALVQGSAAQVVAFAELETYGPHAVYDARPWYAALHAAARTALAALPLQPATLRDAQACVKPGVAFEYDWAVERVPLRGERNVLVTAALPYVNNVPHLGNIIGAVLSADVYARYSRLAGRQTLFVCGTDEYGTATETKALEEGVACADLCAKYFRLHAAVYEWFGIATDRFGRSSTPRQTATTHEIFAALHANGYFAEQAVEQAFCTRCTRFLADRYVEGTCPACGYADARGDQCDACGRLLNPVELLSPRCKVCRGPPERRESTHLFLDLAALQPLCERFVDRAAPAGHWSANSTAISRAWLAEGLRPRCMTRDLRWGTPVPLAGYEHKVFYVWFDACFGYISITAGYTPEHWRAWWQARPEAPVELHQFMGKDNVPFHTVIFPCTLLGTTVPRALLPPVDAVDASVDAAAGKAVESSKETSLDDAAAKKAQISDEALDAMIEGSPWTLLHHINTTEYLNYEDGKFSKSRGVGVFGNDARDSGVPQAYWRYYLLAVRPETTDTAFSWDDFGARVNSELIANIGNLASRLTKFCAAKMAARVPAHDGALDEHAATLVARVNAELAAYRAAFEDGGHIRAALRAAMAVGQAGNAYLTAVGLDARLLAERPAAAAAVVALGLNLLYVLSVLLEPFVPTAATDMRRLLNAPGLRMPAGDWQWDALQAGHAIHPQPFLLFTRLERVLLDDLRLRFSGKQVK